MEGEYLYSVLTVNTNGYEKIHEVKNPNPKVEYVCVTDDESLTSETWKIIYKKDIWFLDVKHNVFDYVNTDVCLWLDGSYEITDDPTNELVLPFISSEKDMMISLHDVRTNVFDEMCQWWICRNIPDENIKMLCKILIDNGMTGLDILFQTSCFLIKNTGNTKFLYEEIRRTEKVCSVVAPYRDDQVITSLCIAKIFPNWERLTLMSFEDTSNNKFFHWCQHGTNVPVITKNFTTRCWNKENHLYRIGHPFD